MTLPRDLWDGKHPTDHSLQEIVSLLPGPVTKVYSQYYGIDIAGKDAQDEPFRLSVARRWTNEDVAFLGQLSELRLLGVGDTTFKDRSPRVTDDALAKLAGLAKLTSLVLDTRNVLTDESLKPLATMSALETVEIKNVRLESNGLDWLAGTPKLTSIMIRNGSLAANALARLSDVDNLERLTLDDVVLVSPTKPIDGGAVTQIKFDSRTISVDECHTIARFESLKSLSLSGRLSDDHLEALAPLRNLSWFRFATVDPREGPPCTPKGLLSLRRSFSPKGKICCNTLATDEQQLLADQFGWTFSAYEDIDSDTLPEVGIRATADAFQHSLHSRASVLQPMETDGRQRPRRADRPAFAGDRFPRTVSL